MTVEKWIVTSAWPYAHGTPHLGNIVSSLLSADIFARYLKLKGYSVISVTGSDEHGTPIEVEAIQRNIPPKKLTDEIHGKIIEILDGFNIRFDNYTRTHNPVHIKFVQDTFRKIYENGYIFKKIDKLLYCEYDDRYLPDRFVIGTCPYCGYESARGDQCENCGRLLDPLDLKNPKCTICGNTPVVKEVTHFYFDLPKFTDKLIKWLETTDTLTDNAKNFSLQMIRQGLKPRAITRNNKWGIPAPFPEADDLTIYVWFDAVLGYVSAVIEYFKKQGVEDEWRNYWLDEKTNVAFFIGKDNIPFHTIIFPSLLMATHDNYTLNFYIGATEWLTFEGKKFSKSKGIGIWGEEAIKLLPADYWRYTLTYIRPETRDTDFKWDILEYCVNKELNDDLGNLVHRVLTMIDRYLDSKVTLAEASTENVKRLREMSLEQRNLIDTLYMNTRFQKVVQEVMKIVRYANSVINEEEPWRYSEDKDRLNQLLYNLALTIRDIAIYLLPIIPESSSKILSYLGIEEPSWDLPLESPDRIEISKNYKPLFTKINKEELKKRFMELRNMSDKAVSIDEFMKLDIRVGYVEKAENKEGSKNLIRLKVRVGDKTLNILAGLRKFYKPEELEGKKVIVVTNLEKKKIMGEYSEGMILAADDEKGNVKIITVDGDIEDGARVR